MSRAYVQIVAHRSCTRRAWRPRAPLALAALLWLASPSASAQEASTAIIVGDVTDASGGVLPGAVVTLTHVDTNAVAEIHTDERGRYRTPPLRLGVYELRIELAGFKRFAQRGLVLNIGDVRQVNAVLQAGDVSETIDVAGAEAPLLQTADSTVGTVITNRQIKGLPLNGRDYLQLAALSSGTIPAGNGVGIGGQAGTQVAFLLDGQDNNNQQISTGHSGQKEVVKPSIDAIQEFRVVTNGYSAEFGRSSSGVVSVALKSGTNDFHGAVYEFLRNDALDAKNFFATEKAPYNRNQFGAALGGPIVRNKTFFFADFESGIIRRSSTIVSTLPSAAQRQGQFSATIRDPQTGQAFADNRIPQDRIDPVAARILGYVPLPQTAAATANYIYNSPDDQDTRRWDVRVDQILGDKQNVYVRYSYQQTKDGVSSSLPPDAQGNYYAGGGAETSDSHGLVLVHNRVWSPRILSSVRLGWNSLFWNNVFPDQALTGVGIPGVLESNPGFSQIAITGYPSLGVTNVPNTDGSQNRQVSGDVTWSGGAHTVKTGVQAYWLQTNFYSSQRSSGIFNFNGQYTGSPFADFLLGYASSASLSKYAYLRFRVPYTHLFVQDDWRVSPRLTLNLGLRYELSPPAVEKQDKIANFDMDTTPGSPQLVLAGAEGSGRAARALQDVSYKQFAPRAGFAYSLNDKTVVRGGYGIFYSNFITLGGMSSMEINPPNHLRISQSTDRAQAPSIVLSQGFAADALTPSNARNVTLISYDRNDATPTAQQWNLDIQRELPGGLLFQIGYYANKFDHNWRSIDGNPAPPAPGDINARRLYTSAVVPGTTDTITLSNVVRIAKDGYSRYHGLQAKVEKRYRQGLSFLASYAWSKTMALEEGVQNPLDANAERALAGTDVPHHFVGSAIYELPFGRGKAHGASWNALADALLGGWRLAPIVTISAGKPLNLTVNGSPSNTGQNDRPNVVGDWRLDDPTVEQWFDTSAFVANAPYTYGNAGRNILRGPGTFNLDIALHKTFRVTERVTGELRLESFNATNTPPLGNPNTQVGNANFGRITSAGAPRSNQIGLKLLF